jgi:hypothetical protein
MIPGCGARLDRCLANGSLIRYARKHLENLCGSEIRSGQLRYLRPILEHMANGSRDAAALDPDLAIAIGPVKKGLALIRQAFVPADVPVRARSKDDEIVLALVDAYVGGASHKCVQSHENPVQQNSRAVEANLWERLQQLYATKVGALGTGRQESSIARFSGRRQVFASRALVLADTGVNALQYEEFIAASSRENGYAGAH